MTGGVTRGGPRLPALAVAVSAVIWGLWWIPLRWLAERGLPGDWASFAIYAAAAAILVPGAWRRRRRLAGGGLSMLLAGGLFGVMLAMWNHAVLVGEVVRVVLLFYLAPVWATILGAVVLRQPVGPARVGAVVLGLAGEAVILGVSDGWPVPRVAAEWLGLGAGLLFAMAATATRRAGAGGDFERTFVSFAVATLAALAFVAFAPPAVAPSGREMLASLPLAALTAALWVLPGTWLVFWGAARLDPGRVSILLLLEIVAAALSASLLTDEPFGWREAGGCVLIVLAGALEAAPDLLARRNRRLA